MEKRIPGSHSVVAGQELTMCPPKKGREAHSGLVYFMFRDNITTNPNGTIVYHATKMQYSLL